MLVLSSLPYPWFIMSLSWLEYVKTLHIETERLKFHIQLYICVYVCVCVYTLNKLIYNARKKSSWKSICQACVRVVFCSQLPCSPMCFARFIIPGVEVAACYSTLARRE